MYYFLSIYFLSIFTNRSARAGYDRRSIFKRSLTGLNSEFSFSNIYFYHSFPSRVIIATPVSITHWVIEIVIKKLYILLWTRTYDRAKAGRPARTYIQQLCEDRGCSPEDLPEAMNDREKRRERVSDIHAGGTTWWYIYIYIYIYISE